MPKSESPTRESTDKAAMLSRPVWLVMLLLAGGLPLAMLTAERLMWVSAMLTAVTEGGLTAMLVIAAGGYGALAVRRLAPAGAPTGLVVATSCGAGLWLLGTVMLIGGSWIPGMLTPWVWWPIVAGGLILAAWQGKAALERFRAPKQFDKQSLAWVLIAAAAGLWLAGATRPPGSFYQGLATQDQYDVLEYHLQLPREYFDAGEISVAPHNVYSHYPLGTEMLFLIGMCLRNGAYEGVYVAHMLHGALGVLAVMAVYGALKPRAETHARIAAAMLATTPYLIYMGWLAMVELSMVFHLALAVLWLREWLHTGSGRAAWLIGLACGAACAAKYLSVGFVAGPVLAVMLALALARAGKARHVLPAAAMTLALTAPWLVRNVATTGNPVFPLATRVLGGGSWQAECEQRWVDGHGPAHLAPVPPPPDWKPREYPSRLEHFYGSFLRNDWLGTLVLMIAGVALCAMLASPAITPPWEWGLLGVGVLQLLVWIAFTHGMPPRFILIAIVPIVLLASAGLARLAGVPHNPLRRRTEARGKDKDRKRQKEDEAADAPPAVPWGRTPAVLLTVLACGVNLAITWKVYEVSTSVENPETGRLQRVVHHGLPMDFFLREFTFRGKLIDSLGPDACLMLVGEARALVYPGDSVYATVFNPHPLAELDGQNAEAIAQALHRRGVTHVWVNWSELWRLANTYGCWGPFSRDVFAAWQAGRAPHLAVLGKLKSLGMKEVSRVGSFPLAAPGDGHDQPQTWPALSVYALPWAPTTQPAKAQR